MNDDFFNINQLIVQGIGKDGYMVIDDVFSSSMIMELHNQFELFEPNAFKPAGIGRDHLIQTNQNIRSDRILWLDQSMPMCQRYFQWSELLRLALNQSLYLGLFEYECMFAHYNPGAFYKKHVDAFKNSNNRKISTVLYLNHDWKATDGGELVLYQKNEDKLLVSILPEMGRLVVFLSEEYPHEVLPSKVSRYSLTGWFRIKT